MAALHLKANGLQAYPKPRSLAPKILIFNKQRDVPLSVGSVRFVVQEFLLFANKRTDEVSIYFVTDKKIRELHQQFFNDPTSTDCISFPIDDENEVFYHVLGEIFISPKAAINYLAKKGRYSQKEIYQEVTLYLIHGLLHLCGYNDVEKKDRVTMRRLEKKYMGLLTRYICRKKVL